MAPRDVLETLMIRATFLAMMFLVTFCFGTGCAIDRRPSYVAPELPDSAVATLKGENGYFINEVDGAPVKSGQVGFFFFGMGGNTVRVAPGDRRLRLMANGTHRHVLHHTNVTLLAGRTYIIKPADWILPLADFIIVDQTSNSPITTN
jgi:hypothetical protein